MMALKAPCPTHTCPCQVNVVSAKFVDKSLVVMVASDNRSLAVAYVIAEKVKEAVTT